MSELRLLYYQALACSGYFIAMASPTFTIVPIVSTWELHVTFILPVQSSCTSLNPDFHGIKVSADEPLILRQINIFQPTHTHTPMDSFASLFTVSNAPEAEPISSTPIDAGGGGSGGCIVA